jgi:hypothetical protein
MSNVLIAEINFGNPGSEKAPYRCNVHLKMVCLVKPIDTCKKAC